MRGEKSWKRFILVNTAHAVFTADKVTIVCLELDSPLAFIAKIVPVADVIPGIIETSSPANEPVIIDRIPPFFVLLSNFGSSIICFGMLGCVAREVSRVGRPNNPDSAGKRTGEFNPMGDSTAISKMMRPKIPERRKTNNANPIPFMVGSIFFVEFSGILAFSVPIIKIVIQIKT